MTRSPTRCTLDKETCSGAAAERVGGDVAVAMWAIVPTAAAALGKILVLAAGFMRLPTVRDSMRSPFSNGCTAATAVSRTGADREPMAQAAVSAIAAATREWT